MIGVISPFLIPLAAAAIGLDYLRRSLQPEAPETNPVGEPYTPPFLGGQCEGDPYSIIISATFKSPSTARTYYFTRGNTTGYSSLEMARAVAANRPPFIGAIPAPSFSVAGITGTASFGDVGVIQYAVSIFEFPEGFTLEQGTEAVAEVINRANPSDPCGNLGDPSPSEPISTDGLADSLPVDTSSDSRLVLGSPLAALPSIAAILAAINAAVKAATDALAAIKGIMDAIQAIGDLLEQIKDWLEDKDREDDAKKDLMQHEYGSIRKDGFLRLYPSEPPKGFAPQFIDLQLLSIPIGYGKYFGKDSPNFYRFQSLGHISFVSSTRGIISTHEIEFNRMSLTIPENTFGFFYHLGLDDAIKANVTLFYLQSQEEE